MDILEALWNGRICPAAKLNYRQEEYYELMDLFARNEKNLLSTLDREQQEDLQKMKALWEEMDGITECAAFYHRLSAGSANDGGFCLTDG